MIRRSHTKSPARTAAPKRARDLGRRLEHQRKERRKPAEKRPGRAATWLRRWAAGASVLVAALVLSGALLLGGFSALAGSGMFLVRKAEVTGTSHLSRLEVLSAARVGDSSNLLALPVGKLERRVSALPWVAEASVSRRLPDTVRIKVREKKPRVLALVAGRLHCLDGHMTPFAVVDAGAAPDLPVITGLTPADLASPDDETADLLALAASVLHLVEAGKAAGDGRLSELHLDRVNGLSLVFEGMPPVVRLGFDNLGRALSRLTPVAADLKRRGELDRALIIDLQAPDRAVVRLSGESA